MSDNFLFVQAQSFTLAGAGAVIGNTTITLTSLKQIDGTNLVMSDFGNKGFMTLEPNAGNQEEQISFTGITQNSNGTATLEGVSNVLFISPYTETSGLAKTHPGGSLAVVSNTSGFYNELTGKDNDETITGVWTFEAVPGSTAPPILGTDLTNRDYVLSVVSGGTVSFDKEVISGTAGENLSSGNAIYLKVSDGRWYKTDADDATTVDNVQLGIAQGVGSTGVAISGGVLVSGLASNLSGLSANTKYYFGNTAGGFSSSAGTIEVTAGFAISTTAMYFFPRFDQQITENELNALSGGGAFGTLSATNKVITQDYLSSSTGIPVMRVYTANDTWSKPAGLKYIVVEVVGGGGGGGGLTNITNSGGGGGGGGYSKEILSAASLGATEAVTVGAAGTAGTAANAPTGNGGTGGTSSFGTSPFLQATGGVGGDGGGNSAQGGGGGVGSNGNLNTVGEDGGAGGGGEITGSSYFQISGSGGSSHLGGGAGSVASVSTENKNGIAGNNYGGGGSGAANANNASDATGGVGFAGVVIVTEYYA